MSLESYDLTMVFKRTLQWDFEETDFTVLMLHILRLVDGKRTINEIIHSLGLSTSTTFSALRKLQKLGVIAKSTAQEARASLNQERQVKVCYRGAPATYLPQTQEIRSEKQRKPIRYRGTLV